MELYPHLAAPVPGPRGRAIIAQEDAALATSTKFLPLVVKNGRGPLIEDEDGNVFLDFACGVCVTNLGHAHPRVVAAVRDQAGKFLYSAGTDFYYDVQARLASRLTT
ncbi:MAG: aminotransferase class III-fold pyridoxal phosphate-dependent enzyme, partial [Acidobacteriota bacterium]